MISGQFMLRAVIQGASRMPLRSAPTSAAIAAAISRASRARFSIEPP